MRILTYMCAIFLLLLGISFSLLNSSEVKINYFLGDATLPTSLLVIISVAIGAIISFFICILGILRHKTTIYSLKRKLEALEKKTLQNFSEVIKK